MKHALTQLITILLFATLSYSIVAEPSKTTLPLAGIAVQEKLRVPIVYAAVFSQHYTQPDFRTNPNYPLRMEVRYIQDKFSKRQNHQLWIERILINTPRSELDKLSQELLEFSKLMKHEMKQGDQLVFEYYPGAGTRVILNEVILTRFDNFEFQKALTAIWFGKRPPTIIFQEDLLSKPDPKLVSKFNDLSFDAQRKREITRIFQPLDQTTRVAKTETKQSQPARKKPTKTDTKASSTKTKQEQASKKPPTKKTASQPQKKTSGTPSESKKKVVKPAKKETAPQQGSSQTVNREKPVETKTPESNGQVKSTRAATTFDQIILEMKDDYVEDVKNYIESKAKPIPPRKVRRKPKDNARILVSFKESAGTIDVIDSKIIAGEFQPELVEVLHESIKSLKKIPLMPTPINDQTLTVEVELSFSKCKRTPSAWLCF